MAFRPFGRIGRRLVLTAAAAFFLIGMLPVGRWLSLPLEERFPPPAAVPAHVDGIVVLGGAIRLSIAADRGQPALNDSAERMTEALALARRYPAARLVFTGGIGALRPGRLTEADVAREFLRTQGLDIGRITFESRSRNTHENAVLTRALVDPKPGQVWLLVTSANHMPRSTAVFRKEGWDLTPWPVDYSTGRDEAATWTFNPLGNLKHFDDAAYEWAGLFAYRAFGWTDEWFPGP